MRLLCSWTTLAVLVLGACLALVSVPAHAAEDAITQLSVHYNIQADGTVRVEQEMDWRFAASGRHGIDFSIATRERWEDNPSKDVLYEVSNIEVNSPSGAPDEFTQSAGGYGSVESMDLRIGDPDVTLEGREATYVISYDLQGALRTFDGTPEFFWDVTSEDNPEIKRFEITVSAPEGVAKARCLQGTEECDASLSQGGAVLGGRNVPAGTVLTAVAALPPGSVSGAEPRLEEKRLIIPALQESVSTVDVLPSGAAQVEQTFTYRLPWDYASDQPSVDWTLPTRRPFSDTQDQIYEITDIDVRGADEVRIEPPFTHTLNRSFQEMRVVATLPQDSETIVVTLSYTVQGAVSTDADSSMFAWIFAPVDLYDNPVANFSWTFPGRVNGATCARIARHIEEPGPCDLALVAGSDSVTWNPDTEYNRLRYNTWFMATLDPTAVGGAVPTLAPSLDAAAMRTKVLTGVAAVLAALVFSVGGGLLGRVPFRRSRRWADVAPGLNAPSGSPTRPVLRSDNIPVRFDEPGCSLEKAGLVLDQRPSPRHTAAVLVHMATGGAVQLRSSPFEVTCISDADLSESLELTLYRIGASASSAELPRKMQQAVVDRQEQLLKQRSLFEAAAPIRNRRSWLLMAPGLFVFLLILAPWLAVPGWLGPHGGWIVLGAIAGAIVGSVLAWRVPFRVPLTPVGTALQDQVVGFRTYIETAEANQLNFEANTDIYRRYLPWAVLFDLSERWTRVCQDLADAGRIPELTTSFWAGNGSAASMASELSSLSSSIPSVHSSVSSSSSGFFSGGGSGGSSGFSGGSSGGGGGGGTSSSSW